MSERIVDNPANHGWLDIGGGKWKWAGTGSDYDDTEIRGLIADNASDIADLQALPHVDAYTKSESDAAFVPKSGDTTISGTLTATDMVATG